MSSCRRRQSSAFAEGEAVATSQRDDFFSQEAAPDAQGRKAEDDGQAELHKQEEVQGLSAKAGEPEEVQALDKELALPVAEIERVDVSVMGNADSELSMQGDEVEHHLQGGETKDEINQDEDIYMWIEHVREVLHDRNR